MRQGYAVEPVSSAERQRQYRERLKNRVDQSASIERQARLLVMQLRTHDEQRVVLRLPDSSTPAEDYLSRVQIVRFYEPTIITPAAAVTLRSGKKPAKRNVTAAAKSRPPTPKRKAK